MKKVKVEMSKEKMEVSEKEVAVLGKQITVVNKIPYAEKEKFAMELANSIMSTNDDIGFAYESHHRIMMQRYFVVKYYTNMLLDDVIEQDALYKMYDLILNSGAYEEIEEWASVDIMYAVGLANDILRAAIDAYNHEHSLSCRLNKFIGSTLDSDGDIAEQLAEGTNIKDTMLKMFDALREKEQRDSESIENQMKLGGVVLNFAKKDNPV